MIPTERLRLATVALLLGFRGTGDGLANPGSAA